MIKKIYHQALKVLLRLFGLDFSWYQTFYVHCFHAITGVETLIQLFRTRKGAFQLFDGYNLEQVVKKGDTVLDIGANIGTVSSRFLTLRFKVHAYEPDSRCIAFLKRRFANFDSSNFYLHHCAVGDHEGRVHLNYGHLTSESNSILEDKPGTGDAGGEDVALCDIQSILDSHDYVSLIKMDIEGAEYDVLDKMLTEENIKKFGVCLVEVHANKIPTLTGRHEYLVEKIDLLGLEDRVFLTWH